MPKLKLILPILILIVLVLVFLNKGLTGKKIFYAPDEIASDLLDFNFANRYFVAENLKAGKIPFWDPYIGNGFPLVASAQPGVFYPLNLLLFKALPVVLAFNWSIILSVLLVALGTYFLARHFKLSVSASLLAAISFTFSGFMIGHLRHVPMLNSFWPFPWLILLTDKIAQGKGNFLTLAGLSLLVAFSVFGGHLSTTAFLLLALAVWFFLRVGASPEGEPSAQKTHSSYRPFILFAGALVLGILLASIQLLPTLEMIQSSNRASIHSLAGMAGLGVKNFITFISPYILGDPSRGDSPFTTTVSNFWETAAYIGIIPLILALVGLFLRPKSPLVKSLIWFLIFGLLMTLGSKTPFMPWIFQSVPGLKFMRLPIRFLFVVDFSLVFLAAMTFDWLKNKLKPKIQLLLSGLVIFLVILDLGYFFYPFIAAIDSQKVLASPKSVEFLKEDRELFRIFPWGTDESFVLAFEKARGWQGNLSPYLANREVLPAEFNQIFHLQEPGLIYLAYSPGGQFSLQRTELVMRSLIRQGLFNDYSPKLLGLMNVKYLLAIAPFPQDTELPADFVSVKEIEVGSGLPNLRIYQNKKFLPRAFLVADFQVEPDPQALLNLLLSEKFSPLEKVLLEKTPKLVSTGPLPRKSFVKITSYENQKVTLKADLGKPAFLVLTDSYYPGWQAKVDGTPTEIFQADYLFRAIELPAGNHQIEFEFKPTYQKLGLIISLITLAGLVFGSGVDLALRRRQGRAAKRFGTHQKRPTGRPKSA